MLPTISTGNVASALAGEYEVANSCRFNSDAYMVKNIVTPTNQKKYTISVWVKRSVISSRQRIFSVIDTSNTAAYSYLEFQSDDRLNFDDFDGSSTRLTRTTNRLFRDPSAWYNIIIAVDTTLSSASSRVKMYINGIEETSFSGTSNASQDFNTTTLNSSKTFRVGEHGTAGFRFGGYMTEFILVDGQTLDQTSFGATNPITNIWETKTYTGTYGNNGFKLTFADSSALGDDTSGNGNDFTVTSLASTDQSTDTCSNNFATLNPLNRRLTSNAPTYSEGNLKLTGQTADGANNNAIATIGDLQSGKWYFEVKCTTDGDYFGVGISDGPKGTDGNAASNANAVWYNKDGTINYGTSSSGSYGNTYTDGDIIGVAFDLDNGAIYFYKN